MKIKDELNAIEAITSRDDVRNANVSYGCKSVKIAFDDKEYILSNSAYNCLLISLLFEED